MNIFRKFINLVARRYEANKTAIKSVAIVLMVALFSVVLSDILESTRGDLPAYFNLALTLFPSLLVLYFYSLIGWINEENENIQSTLSLYATKAIKWGLWLLFTPMVFLFASYIYYESQGLEDDLPSTILTIAWVLLGITSVIYLSGWLAWLIAKTKWRWQNK